MKILQSNAGFLSPLFRRGFGGGFRGRLL